MKKRETILVVDDVKENLDIFVESLSDDYEIAVAVNGLSALKIANRISPDIILLDIMMPDMDGYEVCRILKSEDQLKDIPVIFISALSDVFDKVKAFEAGGIDYVSKPFEFAEIKIRIKNHLKLRSLQKSLEKKNKRLTDYIDIMVNEIRGPLTTIKSVLSITENSLFESMTPAVADDFHFMDESLTGIIEKISLMHDLRLIESGSAKLNLSENCIEKIIENVLTSLPERKIKEKIDFKKLPGEKIWVICDSSLVFRGMTCFMEMLNEIMGQFKEKIFIDVVKDDEKSLALVSIQIFLYSKKDIQITEFRNASMKLQEVFCPFFKAAIEMQGGYFENLVSEKKLYNEVYASHEDSIELGRGNI